MDLRDKVALVTGASRGVGAATAVALAEAGCHVACAARSTAEQPQKTPGVLEDTVARVAATGREGIAVATNLAVQEQVEAMVQSTHEHFGRLDILINNAAISFVGDLDVSLKRHDLMMEVNLRAPFIATRLAAAMFRIDIPVASEGFLANTPTADHTGWEPPEVAAEGILWMLRQPVHYSGRRESMQDLREREGIMASRAEGRSVEMPKLLELFNGLAPMEASSAFEGMSADRDTDPRSDPPYRRVTVTGTFE